MLAPSKVHGFMRGVVVVVVFLYVTLSQTQEQRCVALGQTLLAYWSFVIECGNGLGREEEEWQPGRHAK